MAVEIIERTLQKKILSWKELSPGKIYKIEKINDIDFNQGWIGQYVLVADSDELTLVAISLTNPKYCDCIQFTMDDPLEFSGPYDFEMKIFV